MAIMGPYHYFCGSPANDIPDESHFLNDYTILRNNRTTKNNKSKHGEMLIAVKSMPHERIFLETKQKVNVVIKVHSKDDSKVICCLYISQNQSL